MKSSLGTVYLTGNNTYTGGTYLSGSGILGINNDAALGAATSTLTFTGNSTLQAIASLAMTRTINISGGGVTASFDTNGYDMSISGSIGGSGKLQKIGNGTLTFTGTNNTYTGGTTVSAGTLALVGASNILPTRSPITITGGVLDLGGFSQATTGLITFSGGVVQNGTLVNTSSTNRFTARSGTVSAVLSGLTGLVKLTSSAAYLTAVNTYSGGTTLGSGTLNIASAAALGNPNYAVAFTGNSSLQAGGAPVTLTQSINISTTVTATIDARVNNMTLNGLISSGTIGISGGTLAKAGTGILTLNNPSVGTNDYLATVLKAGTLILGSNNVLPTNASLTVAGGTLDLGGFTPTIAGQVTITGGLAYDGTITSSLLPFMAQGGTISAVLAGPGGLTKTNTASRLFLTASNAYTGGTTLGGGTVNIVADTAPGDPNYALTFSVNSTLQAGSSTVTLSRPITINSGINATFDTLLATNSMTISSAISGVSGTLTKAGLGLLTLTNTAGTNNYLATVVNGGTLALADNVLPAIEKLTISGGTLDLGGFSVTTLGLITITKTSAVLVRRHHHQYDGEPHGVYGQYRSSFGHPWRRQRPDEAHLQRGVPHRRQCLYRRYDHHRRDLERQRRGGPGGPANNIVFNGSTGVLQEALRR